MDNLIEVKIENRSYIKLLGLEEQNSKTLRLTTLVDNQTAVIIKVFLNKSGEHILIKEFNVRNLKPKASGIPRFELESSYSNKILNLELNVDGEKFETSDIKLASYLRNKFLPLFILLGFILIFLLFAGGKWLFSSFKYNETPTTIEKPVAESTKNINPVQPNTSKQNDKINEIPHQSNTNTQAEKPIQEATSVLPETTEDTSEVQNTAEKPVEEIAVSEHTAYFTPNNASISKDTALILKGIAKKLKTLPEAEVEISGYCAMTGTEEGRDRLSRERAYKVLYFLKKEGWLPETEPVIKWYGGERPVTLNEDEIYKNRRVEISIVSH